jgi:hypothetical protein
MRINTFLAAFLLGLLAVAAGEWRGGERGE